MFNELGPVSAICSFLGETGRNGHTFASPLHITSGIAHNLLKLVMENRELQEVNDILVLCDLKTLDRCHSNNQSVRTDSWRMGVVSIPYFMEDAAIRVPVPPSWGHAGEQSESQSLSDQKPAKTPSSTTFSSFMLTYVSFFSSVLHFPEARSTFLFNLNPNVLLWLLKASIKIHPKNKKTPSIKLLNEVITSGLNSFEVCGWV